MGLASEIIKKNKSEIIDQWEKTVNEEVKASRATSTLALRNIVPNLLDDTIEILDKYEGEPEKIYQQNFEEIVRDSVDHRVHHAS